MTTPQPCFSRNVRPQIFLLCLTAFLAGDPSAHSQQTVPPTESYVRIGQDFLRALYPELNGKKYTVTLETSVSYDDPESMPKFFMLDVGAGAKYAVISCCIGGEMGTVPLPPSPMPYPPELGPPPPPPPAPPLPKPKKRKRLNIDARGAVHPDQYLSTRDSVIGSRGRRMCLINCSVGSFCEANEIRMTLFFVFRGLFDVLSSPVARCPETPQILGKNRSGE